MAGEARRLAALLAPPAALLLALAALAAAQGEGCRPGELYVNVSGHYVCVPAASNATAPFGGVSAWYAAPGEVRVRLWCGEEGGCSFRVLLVNATGGNAVWSAEVSLGPGEEALLNATVPGSPPLLANATVNGYQLPLFVVPPYSARGPGAAAIRSEPALWAAYALFALGPLVGALLRGSGREAGVALLALSVFVPRVAIALGVDPPVAYVATGLSLAAGLALALTWRD